MAQTAEGGRSRLRGIADRGSSFRRVRSPLESGGWLLAARKIETDGALKVDGLFAGFKDTLKPLLVLGALVLAATPVIGAVEGAFGVGAVMGMTVGGAQRSAGGMVAAIGAGMLALLIGLALGLVVAMAIWFAPALAVFHNVAPVDALKAALRPA